MRPTSSLAGAPAHPRITFLSPTMRLPRWLAAAAARICALALAATALDFTIPPAWTVSLLRYAPAVIRA
jgi:hypothetical protein